MIVLGLDSATTTGYAAVRRGPDGRERLLRYGTVRASTTRDVVTAADLLAALRPETVVIEGAYVAKNARTGLALAERVGRWRQEFGRRGFRTEVVTALEWQRQVLTGLIGNRSDRYARKRAAQLWAKSTYSVELNEDEADAACMATWVLRRQRWARRAA